MSKRLEYDIGTGMFLPRETAVRVTMARVAWEHKRKAAELSAPPPGYGLDGRPKQKTARNK